MRFSLFLAALAALAPGLGQAAGKAGVVFKPELLKNASVFK